MKLNKLTILSGLFDHMVIQRNKARSGLLNLSGFSPFAGRLSVSLREGRSEVRDFRGGAVKAGRFQVSVGPLPVGGPFDLTVTVRAADGRLANLEVKDVLVGDVWLLGGQSNMQGCGRLKEAAKPHPQVRAFFTSDEWAAARDPIHDLWNAVDPVHRILNGGNAILPAKQWGAGPGPAFGQEMFRLTRVPQGLIPCAHGGTSMAQWDPALKKEGGRSLYGAMLRRLRKNGGKVAGMIWYQGESDAGPEQVAVYTERMESLVRHLRRDAADPHLPVAVVQIGRLVGRVDPPGESDWNAIQEKQRKLPESIPHLAVVPSVDLPLDDTIHISTKGQQLLGQRLAMAMQALRKKPGACPPTPKMTIIENPERPGAGAVVVSFPHLQGKLQSEGRPWGFSLMGGNGLEAIYDTRLQGREVLLLSQFSTAILRDGHLSHGSGANPYCNITDEVSGWPLPVFGPLPLSKPRALSGFLQSWRVAWVEADPKPRQPLPSIPEHAFENFEPSRNFADLHEKILAVKSGSFLLGGAFRVTEPMRLSVCLGYDGPVQVWVDGRKVFEDLKGRPPAWADDGTSRSFAASPGRHEVRVLLGANGGTSWGVFLRLQRLDVRASSEEAPVLPTWENTTPC